MNDDNKELEVASAKRIKYFVNLFYFYLKAKNENFEVTSKNDILILFNKTNDLALVQVPEKHSEVKTLLDSVGDISSKSYTEITKGLNLFSTKEQPLDFLRKSVFKEMQEKHPEFAAEYTRSIF